MIADKCMACQSKLEIKEYEDEGVQKGVLRCPKCGYDLMTLTGFGEINKWKLEQKRST